MILFEEDWLHYPDAIADFKTTNKSFLVLASKFREMGVKNCLFLLALHQPELQGVDPYSPDLTRHQKQMIALECEYNFWYFIREIARIPPIAGIDPISYIASRANISSAWIFLNHIDYLLIQIRQTGKSVSTDFLTSWIYLFAARNAKMLLITKDNTLRSDNVKRLAMIRSYFPEWLIYDDKNDANNTHMVTYRTRGNTYRTAVAQKSEDAALKVGRGATVPVIHVDEGPFIEYVDITIPAALSAASAARAEAALNDMPYGNIFTTTAGKLDSRSGKYMYKMLEDAANWDEALYDVKDNAELRNIVIKNGTGRKAMVAGVFNHRQLGKTDEWLYNAMVEAASTGEAADRDYFNRWTSGGMSHPLHVNILTTIMQSEMNPEYQKIYKEGYIFKWYVKEEEINDYSDKALILGLDTSDAIGSDGISLTATDSETLELLGAAEINESFLPAAAVWVANLLIEHINFTLVIEKKSSAQTFIDTCITLLHAAGIDPFKRMFNRIVDGKDSKEYKHMYDEIRRTPMSRRRESFYEPYRKYFGFVTGKESRLVLYSTTLVTATKRAGSAVRDRSLSGQIRTLENRNGRVDHPIGGHDDMVISWLLGHWLLMYGKNLDHYGIDTTKISVRVGADGTIATEKELNERKQNEAFKDEMEELTEQLKNTREPYRIVQIERRLMLLEKKLENADIDPTTVSDILRDARAIRQKRLGGRS